LQHFKGVSLQAFVSEITFLNLHQDVYSIFNDLFVLSFAGAIDLNKDEKKSKDWNKF